MFLWIHPIKQLAMATHTEKLDLALMIFEPVCYVCVKWCLLPFSFFLYSSFNIWFIVSVYVYTHTKLNLSMYLVHVRSGVHYTLYICWSVWLQCVLVCSVHLSRFWIQLSQQMKRNSLVLKRDARTLYKFINSTVRHHPLEIYSL